MHIYSDIEFQTRIDQGDVFTDIYFPAIEVSVNAVVINPTCDIEHGKASFIKFISTVPSYVVLAEIADRIDIEETTLRSETPLSNTLTTKLVKAIRRNVNGDFLPRYYLLPSYADVFPISYLDFQRVFVVPYPLVVKDYIGNRIARIVSPWKEDILTRYTGYSMRIGVPDYSDDDLKEVIASTGIKMQSE